MSDVTAEGCVVVVMFSKDDGSLGSITELSWKNK